MLGPQDDLTRVSFRDHLEGRADLFRKRAPIRHANGEWRWIQSRVRARIDENKNLKRLVGVETDITERKKLYEEALFREKESAQITFPVDRRRRRDDGCRRALAISESGRRRD